MRTQELAYLLTESESQFLPIKDRVQTLRNKDETFRVVLQTS
jgi:hypothetical protein